MFHVGSDWIEFFYPALKPWIHYIPVPAGSSETELYQLLEFTRDHPDMAQRVAEALPGGLQTSCHVDLVAGQPAA